MRPLRLLITGMKGAGKSTLAGKLTARVGVEALHLDSRVFRSGRPMSAQAAEELNEVMHRRAWIIEGRWCQASAELVQAADVVVWLDLPVVVTWLRVLRRSVRKVLRREKSCDGNIYTWGRIFLHHRLFLDKAIREKWQERRVLGERLPWVNHVRLRSKREVEQWLKAWWSEECAQSATGLGCVS